MKKNIKFYLSSVAATGSLTLPLAVMAQNSNPFQNARDLAGETAGNAGIEAGGNDLPTIVGNIINIVLSFLGILLLLFFLYAGFLWMTAGGDDGKVKLARSYMMNAVIGLIIIVAAYAISDFVLQQIVENVSG